MPKRSTLEKKRDPIIISAIIALIGTVITAILASPVLVALIQRTPSPTMTATGIPMPTVTPSVASQVTATQSLPTQVAQDTLTILPTNTLSVTFQPTNTSNPFESQGDCDSFSPPCTYRVREGDFFFSIAEQFYGNRALVVLIKDANRKSDGTYQTGLKRGDYLFIPAANAAPPYSYPVCVSGGLSIFPCQYSAYRGDTYQIIAEDFYKNISTAEVISDANVEYDPKNDTLIHKKIQEGTILVLPPWP